MDYSGKIITKNPVEPSQTSAPGVWTLDQATQAVQGNNWPIAYVPNPISRSLRFNSADSAYLNRTPASAGNRKTWTWSAWVKKVANGQAAAQTMFSAYTASTNNGAFEIAFHPTSDLFLIGLWDQNLLVSTQVFRDNGAWYHFVVACDTNQGTASNRVRVYVNGVEITAWGTDNRGSYSGADFGINAAAQHTIGRRSYAADRWLNGYMTEVHFVDGQQLDASSFGLTDPRTGAWIPKKYSGTYGTNGFYLNFSDNSTTAALGTDYSGNSNTWTANNFSVTAGSGNDSMTDVPTPWIPYNTTGDVGGVVRGNYATLNPVASIGTYSNGNLDWVGQSSGDNTAASTIGVTSGKWYWEVQALSLSNLGTNGVIYDPSRADLTTTGGYNSPNGYAMDWSSSPPLLKYGGTSTSYGTTITSTSDVVMVALDLDNQKLYFGRNGTWFNSSNPATGTSPAVSSLPSSKTWFATVGDQWGSASSQWSTNFGQRPFAYTPPAGFKSLCTTNLPEPTILDGGDYFNAVTWSGASSGSSLNVTGFGFQPDFIWTKNRNDTYAHYLQDAVRGIGVGNQNTLSSNSTAAEADTAGLATSFLDDGFNINSTSGPTSLGNTQVTWAWKAGGTPAVTNTAGTITSTVSANQTAGFSVVTYTGTGANATVGHGLGAAPAMMIFKNRESVSNWRTYHSALGPTKAVTLDGTGAAQTQSYFWNDTAPTSTVFSLGNHGDANENGKGIVGYLFAPIAGFSAFGSYTGNGSTDGPFVYTGFRARYILIKRSDSVDDWFVYDTARSPYNAMTYVLSPNSSAADTSTTNPDDLSNGFKIRSSSGGTNASGGTYIYACFAENPFKYSNAR